MPTEPKISLRSIKLKDCRPVLRIRDVSPGSGMFIRDPGCLSGIQDQNYSGSRIRIRLKEFKYFLTQNCFLSKLSETWSGMFIPDPDLDFLPIFLSRIQGFGTGSRIRILNNASDTVIKAAATNVRVEVQNRTEDPRGSGLAKKTDLYLNVLVNSDERLLQGIKGGGVEHFLLDLRAVEENINSLYCSQFAWSKQKENRMFLKLSTKKPGTVPSPGFRIRIDLMRIRIRIRIQHFF